MPGSHEPVVIQRRAASSLVLRSAKEQGSFARSGSGWLQVATRVRFASCVTHSFTKSWLA